MVGLGLGETHLELGDLLYAREKLEEAVALAEDRETPKTLRRGRHALASLLMAEGRPEQARSELRECIEVIEQLRSQQLPGASKISMLKLKDRPYEELVVGLCELGSDRAYSPNPPKVTEAFGYAERAKSRLLAEQQAAKDLAVPAGVPAEMVDEERELAGNLRALQDPESRANAAAGAYGLRARADDAARRLREARGCIRASDAGGEEYVATREGAP